MTEIVTMPKLGFDMVEGTLLRWVKAEGEQVNKGEVLAEIETDKATVEVESTFSGMVYRHLVEQSAIVPVGTPIAIIAAPGETVTDLPPMKGLEKKESPAAAGSTPPAPGETPAFSTEEKKPTETTNISTEIHASPLAKRMAKDQHLDLGKIIGTGPGGRVVRRDIELALASVSNQPTLPALPNALTTPPAIQEVPKVPLQSADQALPMEKLRIAIGRRMVEAKQQVPHFYVTHEYDVESLLSLRKEINEILPENEKVSVNDFIIKATAVALQQFPNLNASLAGNAIIRHGAINIGVAVAVEGGLLTVVLRNADLKSLHQISSEVKEMTGRARQGKVKPDDIEGSSFSISNLGMFDVEHFIAIINPPEAAILAVGSAKPVAAVVDGQIQPRTMMKATLSADHRVTDGAEAARFLQALAVFLEQPIRLLI